MHACDFCQYLIRQTVLHYFAKYYSRQYFVQSFLGNHTQVAPCTYYAIATAYIIVTLLT